MRDNQRTDLPHDQIAEDTQGMNPTNDPLVEEEFDNDITSDPLVDEEFGNEIVPETIADHDEIGEDSSPEPIVADKQEGYFPNQAGFEEETAAEVAPPIADYDRRERAPEPERRNDEQLENIETMEREEEGGTALGWTALVLSIISLFFWPLLTASIGVITGFFAIRNGSRTLGMWAIAVGLLSIVLGLFFIPFVR